MTEDEGAPARFERLSDGWVLRAPDGAIMFRHPIPAPAVRAYARLLGLEVPAGAEEHLPGRDR